MSLDARIRDGLTVIGNQLPEIDTFEGYADLRQQIRRDGRRRRTLLVAAASVAVFATLGVLALTQRGEEKLEPAPNPDRSRGTIVVASEAGIHLVREGKDEPTLVSGSFPAFSPDGSRLVYLAPGTIGVPENLMISNVDGTGQRALVDCTRHDLSCGAASWAPDGTRVAVPVLGGPRDELRIVTVATGQAQLHRMPPGEAFDYPIWSADGNALLGVHLGRDGSRIATMDPNVGPASIRDLSTSFERIDKPDWSPDGRYIAFTGGGGDQPWSDAKHPSSLYVVGADGSGQRRVASMPAKEGRIFGVDWTKDERPFLVTVLSSRTPHYIARIADDGSIEPLQQRDGKPLDGWHAVQLP